MKTWYDIYVERMNDHYRQHVAVKYGQMIQYIVHQLKAFHGKKLAEYGCGAANISRLIVEASCKFKFPLPFVHLIDIDSRMLDLARHNMQEAGMRPKDDFAATQANIVEPVMSYFANGYDIIYSHGVLEHFTDTQIRFAISEQLKKAPMLIHYVPSDKYTEPSFGDERLLSPAQWKEICNPTDIMEFNAGYDLLLIWERYTEDAYESRFNSAR